MALLGQAALAMWWDMAADQRAEFEHWHSHEHFPERLAIPGFRRATRWMDAGGGEGVFVMYELESFDVLASAPYLERLNAPSPWSARMMPHHRNMIRSQCRVLESSGAGLARHAATVRLSPATPDGTDLRAALKALIGQLPTRPGLMGCHLLRHQAPAIAQTTEQKIRGGDRVADWVLVITGYEANAVQAAVQGELGESALAAMGAAPGPCFGFYQLSASATPADMT